MKLSNLELANVSGGFTLTATMLNAISRTLGQCFEIGQAVGSSFRRIVYKKYC